MIEPSPTLESRLQSAVARCLVDTAKGTTVKVRVLNPNLTPTLMNQDMVIGHVYHVHLPDDLSEVEYSSATIPIRQVSGSTDPTSLLPEHLTDLYQLTISGKSSDEVLKIALLLSDFRDLFSQHDADLGGTHLAEHPFDTGDALPIKQAPRRTPRAFEGKDRKALEKLLEQGTIRPSTSPRPVQSFWFGKKMDQMK